MIQPQHLHDQHQGLRLVMILWAISSSRSIAKENSTKKMEFLIFTPVVALTVTGKVAFKKNF